MQQDLFTRILDAIEGPEQEYRTLDTDTRERLAAVTRAVGAEYEELDDFREKLTDWWNREKTQRIITDRERGRRETYQIVHLVGVGGFPHCGAAPERGMKVARELGAVTCHQCLVASGNSSSGLQL